MTDDTAPQDTSSAPKKKTWLWVVGGVVALGLVGSMISGGNDAEDAASPEEPAAETSQETTDEDAEFEEPDSYSDIVELEAAINRELGEETNMDLPRDVTLTFDEESNWLSVSFVANENLTTNMTRSGMWRDIGKVFDLARKWEQVEELTVTAQFPLINNLGEELGPQDVVTAYFDPDVYPRINTANLSGDRLGEAASSVRVHPALQ